MIEDATIRGLLAQSIHSKDLRVIEIGTLFGVNGAFLLDVSCGLFDSIKLQCVDPFEGYYDSQTLDIVTGIPVTIDAVKLNMARMGFNESQFKLIPHLSESPEALEACANFGCNYLFIDGDHSYEGVKRDFENYIDLVQSGGLIIFDDYGFKAWPGVKEYIDKEIMPDQRVELIGNLFHTIAFRKN